MAEIHLGEKYIAVKQELETDINRMKSGVEDRMYRSISSGKLTPEEALQAWYEMHSYHRLGQKFNQKVQMGDTARSQLAFEISKQEK